ncbi:MAG: hypothetical protein AB7F74_02895 [Parvibaculaceae bacterium]
MEVARRRMSRSGCEAGESAASVRSCPLADDAANKSDKSTISIVFHLFRACWNLFVLAVGKRKTCRVPIRVQHLAMAFLLCFFCRDDVACAVREMFLRDAAPAGPKADALRGC